MTAQHDPQILIGHDKGDHISIRVLGRMHAEASDYWDGNWLVTPIEVMAGGFRGHVAASLRADELRAFRAALAELNSTLRGEAVLESMEDWLTLRVGVDALGHLLVSGTVGGSPGVGNVLAFEIEGLDVTYLPAVIKSIEEIESRYPVIGTP
jgi:hypothetical protein